MCVNNEFPFSQSSSCLLDGYLLQLVIWREAEIENSSGRGYCGIKKKIEDSYEDGVYGGIIHVCVCVGVRVCVTV